MRETRQLNAGSAKRKSDSNRLQSHQDTTWYQLLNKALTLYALSGTASSKATQRILADALQHQQMALRLCRLAPRKVQEIACLLGAALLHALGLNKKASDVLAGVLEAVEQNEFSIPEVELDCTVLLIDSLVRSEQLSVAETLANSLLVKFPQNPKALFIAAETRFVHLRHARSRDEIAIPAAAYRGCCCSATTPHQ